MSASGKELARAVTVYVAGKKNSNPKIAKVDEKTGKIKGIKKGTCCIYAYAQNGVYKKVTVNVS